MQSSSLRDTHLFTLPLPPLFQILTLPPLLQNDQTSHGRITKERRKQSIGSIPQENATGNGSDPWSQPAIPTAATTRRTLSEIDQRLSPRPGYDQEGRRIPEGVAQ